MPFSREDALQCAERRREVVQFLEHLLDHPHSAVSGAQQLLRQLDAEAREQDALAFYRNNCDSIDGEIEVDANALVSKGYDDGAYVQAWVWVEDT